MRVKTGERVRDRSLITLRGHKGEVLACAVTPDGRSVVSASKDRTLGVWDFRTERRTKTLLGHAGGVLACAVMPDGESIVSASKDQTLSVWDLQTGKPITTLRGHTAPVHACAVTPDGQSVISASDDQTLRVWNLQTGRLTHILRGHTAPVWACAVTPDGGRVVSASWDNCLKVWDLQTGEPTTLRGHAAPVYTCAVTPDGRRLVSASHDLTLKIWDLQTGTLTNTLQGHTAPVWACAVTPDGRSVVSASLDQTLKVWDLEATPRAAAELPSSAQYTNAKLVLVGEHSTGKTCLGRALMGEPFEPQESTHGMTVWTFKSETVKRPDGGRITRETMLWDLAGQTDYQVVHQLFLDRTALGIVLFDPTHPGNPFGGVGHWKEALRRVAGRDCPNLLVAGRTDRGHPAVTGTEIERFCEKHGFSKFIATSAKTGAGVQELRDAIANVTPWDSLPTTSSPQLWKDIRDYILKRRAGKDGLTRRADLREAFRQGHLDAKFSDEEFDTIIGHAEAQGLVWRLSFGDFVLLKPELLNGYASTIVLNARQHPEGLGAVRERDALDARIDFEGKPRVAEAETERSLLHGVVELFLDRELALRQDEYLVFPSKFNLERDEFPGTTQDEVAYRFSGPVEEIYATLVVRLFYSQAFTKTDLWKNAAEFMDTTGKKCGFTLDSSDDKPAVIRVFFEEGVEVGIKVLFLQFIHEHLRARAKEGSVERERIYRCTSCGEEVESVRGIKKALERGRTSTECLFCDAEINLMDLMEEKFADPELLQAVRAMEEEVRDRKAGEVGATVSRAKDEHREFDVFLAHNSEDKPQVREIAEQLKRHGLNPWIDEEQIPPGRWFADVIQQAITTVKSAAIFISPNGLGKWERMELRAFIAECVERDIPVITVLLPGVAVLPSRLPFLKQLKWVRFHERMDERKAMDELVWGITGQRPAEKRMGE